MTSDFRTGPARVHISNLALRTIVGFNDWEREKKQEVVINLWMDFDSAAAVASDKVEDTLDYKKVKRSVIETVEKSRFALLEKLTHTVLETVMGHKMVTWAKVRVDKPHALRFADSVAIELQGTRKS